MSYETVRAGGVPAEWFRPDGCDESRVVLYLHGGGYSIGSIDTHRGPVSRICRAAGARGLVIDYRLAPEHPFPAQLDDALAAYRWLLESGVDPRRIVVAGESAGRRADPLAPPLPARSAHSRCPQPRCARLRGSTSRCVESRCARTRATTTSSREILAIYASRFVGPGDLRNPLANALYADLRGLPPLLVLAGGAEVLLDDARALAARAREAGVDVTLEVEPDMVHAWMLFSNAFATSRATLDRIARFVVQRQGPGAVAALRAS